jgi:hypothetical protein
VKGKHVEKIRKKWVKSVPNAGKAWKFYCSIIQGLIHFCLAYWICPYAKSSLAIQTKSLPYHVYASSASQARNNSRMRGRNEAIIDIDVR